MLPSRVRHVRAARGGQMAGEPTRSAAMTEISPARFVLDCLFGPAERWMRRRR